jgi:hypothetical protein
MVTRGLERGGWDRKIVLRCTEGRKERGERREETGDTPCRDALSFLLSPF